MRLPTHYCGRDARGAKSAGAGRTAADIALIVLVIGAVVAGAASAPSHTYAYAQLNHVGTALAMVHEGDWLLPRNQIGHLPRKPQMLFWMQAGIMKLTGSYNDFIFRLPTVLASLVTGALVYLLGRRWYGRRTGLLAACLWAGMLHMGKLMYVALTDMLFTMWFTAAIVCADRLVFRRRPSMRRRPWTIALWACMILAAMTKGWGLVNVPLIALTVALAAAK